ncbi:MAG: hypothetical protein DSO01_05980 [Archaeoglobi archaeon]|nr:MAG: hypothetical protein DSO01_05980 [Archaeoglobi archaeon]
MIDDFEFLPTDFDDEVPEELGNLIIPFKIQVQIVLSLGESSLYLLEKILSEKSSSEEKNRGKQKSISEIIRKYSHRPFEDLVELAGFLGSQHPEELVRTVLRNQQKSAKKRLNN